MKQARAWRSIVVVVITVVWLAFATGCPSPQKIAVPDVVGQDQANAEAAIVAAKLEVGTVTEAFSDTVPPGSVVSQNPAGGAQVNSGTKVNLVISKGPGATVPDLSGQTQAQAAASLTAANLTLGDVTEAFSDTVPFGQVVSQNPGANTQVAYGSDIDIVISKGPQHVNVPNLVGMLQADAEDALENSYLGVGTVTQAFSDSIQAGRVVSHSPSAGVLVDSGSIVNLVISKGPGATVPNLAGQTQGQAAASLTAVNLALGGVTEAFSDTVPFGQVISQSVAPGTVIAVGSAVDVVVSKGSQFVSVPSVVGQTLTQAQAAILAAHLTVGTVTNQYSNTVPVNQVISQDPASGTAEFGSPVDLVVSSGPQPVIVPNVVGQTQAQATTLLTGAGLTVGTVTEAFSDTAPEGQVISQTPTAGAQVAPSTAVALVVSKGPEPAELVEYEYEFTIPEGGYGTYYPFKCVGDPSGNLYVTCTQRILKIDSTGELVDQWDSDGTKAGTLGEPRGIARNTSGHLYVTEIGGDRVLKFSATGDVLDSWGTLGVSAGQFNNPMDVAVDTAGNVYVVEQGNHRVQKFTADGDFLVQWGTQGAGEGQFNMPGGIAVDGSNNVWVADGENHRIQKFSSGGGFLAQYGSKGTGEGQFKTPTDIAFDSTGNVYVAEYGNKRVQKLTSTGSYLLEWDGDGETAFGLLWGLVRVADGILVVDALSRGSVQAYTEQGAYLWSRGRGSAEPGILSIPSGVFVTGNGKVFVVDAGNSRIQKFDETGTFVLEWGAAGTGNGEFDLSAYGESTGIVTDASNNVYVADTYNHRIQKFASNGAYITQWGGEGTGQGQMKYPMGVAVAPNGNIMVADSGNNRFQEFTPDGDFVSAWGEMGTSQGQFKSPSAIAYDSTGSRYVMDKNNFRIQKFTAEGVFVAAWGSKGTEPGQFNYVHSIAIDSAGRVYVADGGNARVQVFGSDGTYLGEYKFDGCLPGQFITPISVTIDGSDNLYVADMYNHRVQKLHPVTP